MRHLDCIEPHLHRSAAVNFYTRDALAIQRETAQLTPLEFGIHTLFIDWLHVNERPIPLDMVQTYGIVRGRTRYTDRAVVRVLSLCFVKTPEGYIHTSSEEELAKYQAKRDKAKRAAQARWGNADASETHMRPHMQPHSERMPGEHANAYAYEVEYEKEPKTKGTNHHHREASRVRAKSAADDDDRSRDVLDVAKARTRLDALVAYLRENGITNASAAHASVRLWASDPGLPRDVLDEGLARLRDAHNVRSPMSYLAKTVASVIDEREHPHEQPHEHGNVKRTNGHAYDERSQDRKRAVDVLTGRSKTREQGDVIDVPLREIGHAPKRA